MDQSQISEIYDQLALIQVNLEEDPRVLGQGYFSRAIKACRDADERVNDLYTIVQRELDSITQALNLLRLNRKVRYRAKITSPAIRNLEISSPEKSAHAELQLEQEYQAERKLSLEAQNLPVPLEIPTLEQEIVLLENCSSSLRIVLDVIEEKRDSINKKDSAVRLQEKAFETEIKAFGGAPKQLDNTNRRKSPTANGPNGQHPIWDVLQSKEKPETPKENIQE